MAAEIHSLPFRANHFARAGLLGPAVCLALYFGGGNNLARTLRQTQSLCDCEQVVGSNLQSLPTHTLLGQVGEIAAAFLQQRAGPLLCNGPGPVEQSFKHSRISATKLALLDTTSCFHEKS